MSASDHGRRKRSRGRKKQGSRAQRQERYIHDNRNRRERMGDNRIVVEQDMSLYPHSHSGDDYSESQRREGEQNHRGRSSLDMDTYHREHVERSVPATIASLNRDVEREQLQKHWEELDSLDRERFEILVAESRGRMQNALLQSEQITRLLAERGLVSTPIHSDLQIPPHAPNEQMRNKEMVAETESRGRMQNALLQSEQVTRLLAEGGVVSTPIRSDPQIIPHAPNNQMRNKEIVGPSIFGATGQTLDRNATLVSGTAVRTGSQITGKAAQTVVGSAASVCPLMSCRARVPSLQEHVLYTHLPSCFSDILDTSSTTLRKRNVVLHAFAQEFTGGEGLPGLLEMVDSSGLMSRAAEVEADWIPALQAFSKFLGENVPACYTLHPPNTFAVLAHWGVLLQLLCAAGRDMQERYSQQSLAYKIQHASTQSAAGSQQASVGLVDGSVSGTGTSVAPFATSSVPRNSAAQSVASKSVAGSEGYVAAGQGVGFHGNTMADYGSARREVEKEGRKRKRTPSPVGMGSDMLTIEYGHMRAGEPTEVYQGGVVHDLHGSEDRYRDMPPILEGPPALPPSMTPPSESRYRERRMSPPQLSEHNRRRLEGDVLHDLELDSFDDRLPSSAADPVFQDRNSLQPVLSRNTHTQDPGVDQSASGGTDNKLDPNIPSAIDCHFYLDIMAITLFGKERLRKTSVGLNLLKSCCTTPKTNRINLIGGIGTFSNPEHFNLLGDSHSGVEKARWNTEDGRLGLSVGLNPKYCQDVNDRLLRRISILARLPCMKAFGDVGLSYSAGKERDWSQQRSVLRKLLRLAPSSLPVKLSCRKQSRESTRKDGRDAYKDLLDIAKEELSPLQPIYLVSFSGSVHVVEDWIARFPNCYFGISPKCISAEIDVRNAVQSIPDGHLLLESSAPAFQLPDHKKNSPLMLGVLAMYVAKIRGVEDARHVLNVTTENAKRLFNLA